MYKNSIKKCIKWSIKSMKTNMSVFRYIVRLFWFIQLPTGTKYFGDSKVIYFSVPASSHNMGQMLLTMTDKNLTVLEKKQEGKNSTRALGLLI